MKLGISYNLFDGEEHLPASLLAIRSEVDHISVVYQEVSNLGIQHPGDLPGFLSELVQQGLVDEVKLYQPNLSLPRPGMNELIKRNIGLDLARQQQCTHFMTIDADEIYDKAQFIAAKEKAAAFDSTACKTITYYKDPYHVISPPEEHYVPFLYKIDARKFSSSTRWPILADPTRRLEANNLYVFDQEELVMHHLSYVRNDIRLKLRNSSAYPNYKHRVEEIALHMDRWKEGDKAYLSGAQIRQYDVEYSDYFHRHPIHLRIQ